MPLPENTYYIRDLIGLSVINEEDGALLGTIKDVLQPSSQDIYVVALAGGGEAMIPADRNLCGKWIRREGCVRVRLIEGMIEG